jgi:3-hydroxy-9,10-secoandrosta-1,3,5(10)-triene-9,17-dione monooxygenase reductase component
VLWNIAKDSHSLQAYLDAEYFAINVLAAGQRKLSSHFAQSDDTVFNGIEHETSARHVPLIRDSVACFECRTHQVHDCGDHYIIVGEVENYRSGEQEPLLFYDGRYVAMSERQD